MARYGPAAQQKVKKVMHEFKEGKLTIGKSKKKVKNRKQAVAIGLSEARARGAKVPSARTRSSRRTTSGARRRKRT